MINDRNGNVLTNEGSVLQRWNEYFEELMNNENERERKMEEQIIRLEEVLQSSRLHKYGVIEMCRRKENGLFDCLTQFWSVRGSLRNAEVYWE